MTPKNQTLVGGGVGGVKNDKNHRTSFMDDPYHSVLYLYENSFHNLSLQWAFEILIRTPIPISDMDV